LKANAASRIRPAALLQALVAAHGHAGFFADTLVLVARNRRRRHGGERPRLDESPESAKPDSTFDCDKEK